MSTRTSGIVGTSLQLIESGFKLIPGQQAEPTSPSAVSSIDYFKMRVLAPANRQAGKCRSRHPKSQPASRDDIGPSRLIVNTFWGSRRSMIERGDGALSRTQIAIFGENHPAWFETRLMSLKRATGSIT